MIIRRLSRAAVLGVCIYLQATVHAGASPREVRTVALGESRVLFNEPVINNLGEVAFEAYTNPVFLNGEGVPNVSAVPEGGLVTIGFDNLGLYSEGGGSGLTQIAYVGGEAPGEIADGVYGTPRTSFGPIESFDNIRLNDNGQTAFRGYVQHRIGTRPGGSPRYSGAYAIYRQDATSLQLVAYERDQAPGFAGEAEFTNLLNELNPRFASDNNYDNAHPFFLNERGDIAFTAGVSVATDGAPAHESGVFVSKYTGSENTGELEAVFVSGDIVPAGDGTDSVIISFFGGPAINSDGDVTAGAVVSHEGDVQLPFLRFTDRVELLGPSQEEFDARGFINFYQSHAYNDFGQVATGVYFGSILYGNGSGDFELIAEPGDLVPGTDLSILGVTIPVAISNQGETAAYAILTSAAGEQYGSILAFSADGEVSVKAMEGSLAPGLEENVRLDGLYHQLMYNDQGQLAFLASLTDGSRAIFAEDTAGQLQMALRTGDVIDVDNNPAEQDLRTVRSFSFGAHAPWNPSFAFNNRGEVLFTGRLDDGTYGLFVANVDLVPEPRTLTLLAAACSLLTLSQRR